MRRRGTTLIEVLTAAMLMSFVFFTVTAVYVTGAAAWVRGRTKIDAEMSAQTAVRAISEQLREAMAVTVDANGMGLTFRKALLDSSGAYVTPIVWDGVTRRIQYASGQLQLVDDRGTRVLCRDIVTTDPLSPNGTGTYQIFSAGAGSITRSLTVMLVDQKASYKAETVTGRSRETVYLRNIPQLTK